MVFNNYIAFGKIVYVVDMSVPCSRWYSLVCRRLGRLDQTAVSFEREPPSMTWRDLMQ